MKTTIGGELRRLRLLKSETLREVEKATGVSNAYLSQIETDKINEPSPRILQKLAAHYEASYEELMETAGYLATRSPQKAEAQGVAARTVEIAAMAENMTDEQWKFIKTVYAAYLEQERSSDRA